MSRVKAPEVYPGTDLDSIRRAVVEGQNFSLEVDTRDVSAAYTLVSEDDLILVTTGSSNIAITLPFIDDAQRKPYYVKKIDSGTGVVTVSASTGETIDGSTVRLATQYSVCAVIPQRSEGIPTPVRTWWKIPRTTVGLLRSHRLAWSFGSTPPTIFTAGFSPTIRGSLINTTSERLTSNTIMPIDWDKSQDVTLRIMILLPFNETENDTLSLEIFYTTPLVHTTGENFNKTHTTDTLDTDYTAAKGHAQYDMYFIDFILAQDDTENGFAPGDNSIGFVIELYLTNTTQVGSVVILDTQLIYTSLN